jgi:hypothetical protein
MLAVLTVNSTAEVSGLARSTWTLPEKSVNRPRTLLTKWRTWKLTSEWFLSTTKLSAARAGEAAARVTAARTVNGRATRRMCFSFLLRVER